MTFGPFRVLLLEDDPHDVEIIVHNLRRGGVEPVTTVVRSRSDLQPHLTSPFDVIIADYRLPDLDATAAITELRRHQPDTPFVVVSGSVSEEQLLAMLRLGADDYLLKDRLGRLGAAVHTARERQRLRRERENAAALVRQRDLEIRHLQRLQSIGVLTGGIAHDFNNLMTVVLGNCDLLLMALPNHPDARSLVIAMADATKRASSLSKQLLSFARRDSAGAQQIDLREVVELFLALMRSTLGHAIRVEVQVTATLPKVLFDRAALEQVLMNLVLNARDAMPRGGILTVEIGIARGTGGTADRAQIRVADTGTGMSPEVLARAFEPFFTTKPPGQGTGLGLSTTLAIVRQFGGDLEVDSAAGGGSEFRVLLPIPVRGEAVLVTPADAKGHAVLLVEHDPHLRSTLAMLMAKAGFTIHAVGTADEVPARLGAESPAPDVLVVEAAELTAMAPWLANARGKRPRVVALQDHEAAGGDGTGDVVRLRKPFTAQDLLNAIRGEAITPG